MTPAERRAWQKGETILDRYRAAQARTVADLQAAGFPVVTVDEFLRMRAEHNDWERARAAVVEHEYTGFHPTRAMAQNGVTA